VIEIGFEGLMPGGWGLARHRHNQSRPFRETRVIQDVSACNSRMKRQ